MNLILMLVAAVPIIICDVQASDSSSESNDKEILDILLHNKRYDFRIKPPSSGAPLRVNISVVLLSLSSPDESSLHYEVEFLMHQKWVDPRLAQKKSFQLFLPERITSPQRYLET